MCLGLGLDLVPWALGPAGPHRKAAPQGRPTGPPRKAAPQARTVGQPCKEVPQVSPAWKGTSMKHLTDRSTLGLGLGLGQGMCL